MVYFLLQPLQIDYSDLYDIAAFFIGSPEGRVKGRDDLAQQIAEQGRKFAMEHWRWEDMQAYVSPDEIDLPITNPRIRSTDTQYPCTDIPSLARVYPFDGR
jgi:hypothetical protein